MDEVFVSIVIPAYNCTGVISQAIDSALAQDVASEIIVINDCSKDNLDPVMEGYAQYPQVIYLKNEENLGVSATRNRGVAIARGRYVAFLDADDYWEPDKLKKQLKRIKETQTVICSTARELMQPDGTLTGYVIPVKPEYTFADIRRHNQINCSSVLIKTEVAKEFPMHHDDCHEDYLMWLQVLQKYERGCAVNEPLLKYRVSNTGKSGSKLHSAKLTFRTYRYMGMSFFRSLGCFACYAFSGVRKYFNWFVR